VPQGWVEGGPPGSVHRPGTNDSRVARVGPTTPTRARRPFDASVDPTEARNAPGSNNDQPALERRSGNWSFPAVPREITRENGPGGEPGTGTEAS